MVIQNEKKGKVAKVKFSSYKKTITKALDMIDVPSALPQDGLIVLKPNLTTSSPPPVTTPLEIIQVVYEYCVKHTKAKIIIGEGCGLGNTPDIFKRLGYTKFAKKNNIELIDFNTADSIKLSNPSALQLKNFYMPKTLLDAYIISIPILKDHSFTDATIAMKNMFGIAPGKFYHGSWNKSKLHRPSTDKSVVDVCLYKKPDLSIVDATVGLKGSHLSGKSVKYNEIIAGFDPVSVDTVGSILLGHDPYRLDFLTLADGRLGTMKDYELIETDS
jgi:uncharacterized protein (DUF362 family)